MYLWGVSGCVTKCDRGGWSKLAKNSLTYFMDGPKEPNKLDMYCVIQRRCVSLFDIFPLHFIHTSSCEIYVFQITQVVSCINVMYLFSFILMSCIFLFYSLNSLKFLMSLLCRPNIVH